MNPFKYHTVEFRRLWDVTLAGLELNGISTDGLGEKHLDKYVLRGGLNLSQYSLSLLPPHLGGFSAEAPVDMSDRTATFIDAINTASPSGFKGSLANQRGQEGFGSHERNDFDFSSSLDAEDSHSREQSHAESARESSGPTEPRESKLNLTADKDDAEKPEKPTDKQDAKGKKAEKSSRSLPTRASSSSGSQPPSTPPRLSGRIVPAPASIRAHIDQSRSRPHEASAPLAPGPIDPKADQVHVNANASNIRLVSEARQIIARANARFPCITAALLQKCSAAHLPKPNFADLPPTVVIEAARAVMNQEAVLAALLASAIAESATHGSQGVRSKNSPKPST